MTPMATDRSQLFQTGNLDTPTFIVGQMQMQHIDLVRRQNIDPAFHIGSRNKVARHIEHEAAIGQIGIIDNHLPVESMAISPQQGQESLYTVEYAVRRSPHDSNLAIVYVQPILFGVACMASGCQVKLDVHRSTLGDSYSILLLQLLLQQTCLIDQLLIIQQ